MRNEPNPTRLDPKRERELTERARTDGTALGELYDFHMPRLYGYIVRRVGERSIAETMTATTFEQAVAALPGKDFKGVSFGGWLYRTATAALLEYVRSGRQLVPVTGPGKATGKGTGKATGKVRAGSRKTTTKAESKVETDGRAQVDQPHRPGHRRRSRAGLVRGSVGAGAARSGTSPRAGVASPDPDAPFLRRPEVDEISGAARLLPRRRSPAR